MHFFPKSTHGELCTVLAILYVFRKNCCIFTRQVILIIFTASNNKQWPYAKKNRKRLSALLSSYLAITNNQGDYKV